jgi:Holliday junction DNA helicase RuvA
MIHHLEGILEEKPPGRLVIDVSGVGFEVHVADATWNDAGIPGGRIRVLTHLVVREDQWALYGSRREDERALFRSLLDVQGVGPKVALGVMSGLALARLRRAIAEGDVATLTTVSGVGKKTAQRIIVDLKDRVGAFAEDFEAPAGAASQGDGDDAVDALVSLGYSRHLARDAVRDVRAVRADLPLADVVRDALRRL